MSSTSLYLQTRNTSVTLPTEDPLCIFCEEIFKLKKGMKKNEENKAEIDRLKAHLLTEHKFVISDILEIRDLPQYLRYWKKILKDQACLSNYCAVIKTNSKDNDVHGSENYFLLCPDVLSEDREIREKLHLQHLEDILEIQEKERTDESFERQCLFCRKVFSGRLRLLLDHLAKDHNFSVGLPDNLVFARELLDLIETKLENKLCLYCEKTFKDRDTLKEHMRKKQHKQLNPKNPEYDRFYIINYLDAGSRCKRHETDATAEEADDDNWEDWREKTQDSFLCLFCSEECPSFSLFVAHMENVHSFSWQKVKSLSFYEKIKLINFIRRTMYNKTCAYCQNEFTTLFELVEHYKTEDMQNLPSKPLWDAPEYYFSTFENDALLWCLPDNEHEENYGEELSTGW